MFIKTGQTDWIKISTVIIYFYFFISWENVSQKAVKDLNKTISRMENLTKIDLKFER